MKKIFLTFLGVATLLFALTLNFKHAFDDYGVVDNKLHVEILAQSNGSGGSSSGGGGSSGGGSGGYTVTCPSPSDKYGNCRYLHVTEGLYGACMYDCRKSEDPSSTCSWLWENISNFCSAFGGTT